ncbi:MAG: hypothetical protein K0S70_5207, partial [Microbacterium sp.]|nr:hypothetical protein [Microbacterium sp.]
MTNSPEATPDAVPPAEAGAP